MPERVKLWRVTTGDTLEGVASEALDFEERLEKWVADDISVLRSDLMIVGRQVETDHGGVIDLPCLNDAGDCVIVELKRGLTPREVTAQILDYASWVQGLSGERLEEIANAYLGADGPLPEAFRGSFQHDLPDVLNADHAMLIVGSALDAATERIIRYLADVHGVGINAATFQHFRIPAGDELVSRLVLMEEDQERRTSTGKRLPNLSLQQLQDYARANGVLELFDELVTRLSRSPLCRGHTTRSFIAFTGDIDRGRKVSFGLLPRDSSAKEGLCYQLFDQRTRTLLGIDQEELIAALPESRQVWAQPNPDWSSWDGRFRSLIECRRFLELLAPEGDPSRLESADGATA